MKALKDNFSQQASLYNKYRPVYPLALYTRIMKEVGVREHAWDCGTGNGQVALQLSRYFETVSANDISTKLLKLAPHRNNIIYYHCRAEETPFPDKTFDLITIAQALHWFDIDMFYMEVKRVAKPGAIIAAWTYKLLDFDDPHINDLIKEFYYVTTGPYWDEERQLIDDEYTTIPFPFEEIKDNEALFMEVEYTPETFTGYLNSWSSVQKYIRKNGQNPVDIVMEKISPYWQKGEVKKAVFPLYLRMGRVK